MTDASSETLRERLHDIIFEADTPAGKAFDVGLIVAILLSIVAVSFESVEQVDAKYHGLLVAMEWAFTLLFTAEYVMRLIITRRTVRYATSFFGVVDLLAILPTYLSLVLPGSKASLSSGPFDCFACSACSSSPATWARPTSWGTPSFNHAHASSSS